jgi:PKD repeat protein
MPSFILRNLNPDFWSQVQAKAARDGTTVKAVILKLLSAWLAAVVVLGLVSGCSPKSLTAPTPVLDDAAAPYTLTLGAMAGEGVDAGQGAITAKVQNLHGAVLPGIMVRFTTDVGTLSVASMLTTTNGMAATTVTAASSATITATAGTLTMRSVVTSQPVTPGPGTPTPTPTPGPPSAPGGSLSISLSATPATLGTQTIVSANLVGASWPVSLAWTFGDGTGTTSTGVSTSHGYTALGSYVVSAVVRDADGRTASASTTAIVTPAVVPSPPSGPPTGLALTLGCVPAVAGSPTACNVAVTYNGASLASGAVSKIDWDWGDGIAQIVNGSPIATHTYTQAGTYRVEANVSATTVDGTRQARTSTSVEIK